MILSPRGVDVVGGVEAAGVAVLVGAVQLDLELLIAADGRGGGARRARHDGHRQRGQLGLLLLLDLRQPHLHLHQLKHFATLIQMPLQSLQLFSSLSL